MKSSRLQRIGQALLSLVVSGALLSWALSQADPSATLRRLGQVDLRWVAVAAALVPVQVLLCAERWRRVGLGLGYPLPRSRAVTEYGLSTLLNQVLPGGVPGDAMRVWRQRQGPGGFGAALRGVVVERAIGQLALQLVVVVSVVLWLFVHGWSTMPAWVLAVTVAALLGVAVLTRAPASVPGLGRISADIRVLLTRSQGLPIVLLSAAFLASMLAGFAACGAAVGAPLGLVLFTVVPLLLLAMSVPLTVGGWGMREAASAALLPFVGWSAEAGVALSLVYGLSVLLGALPGALVPLLGRR
jgi:uncharacterized membrane protein YbhN (UPF0104 family)